MQKKIMHKWIAAVVTAGLGSILVVQAATIPVQKEGSYEGRITVVRAQADTEVSDDTHESKTRSKKEKKQYSQHSEVKKAAFDETVSTPIRVVKRTGEAGQESIPTEVVGKDNSRESADIPILIAGAFGGVKAAEEKAIQEDGYILIPIDVYRQANLNRVTLGKKGYTVRLNGLRTAGDMVFGNGTGNIDIPVPTVMRRNRAYVNLSRISPVLGVTYTYDGRTVIVASQPGAVEKPVKRTVELPLAWAFDPLATSGVPYTKRLAAKGTSIISPSWFQLEKDGVCTTGIPNEAYVMSYTALGYRVWPLITNGFDPKATHQILSDKKKWPVYVRTLAGYALAYGYDGYNFDFENIDIKDKKRLTEFTTYLSKGLQAYNLFTSMDVTGYSDSPNWSLVYERAALADTLDYMVLMAYDETWASSPKAGPVASYPWVERNLSRLATEVAPEKIVLGVPFYMRTWKTPVLSNGTLGKATSKTLSMIDSDSVREAHKKVTIWDEKKGVYHLTFAEGDTSSHAVKEALNRDDSLGERAINDEPISAETVIHSIDDGNATPFGSTADTSSGTVTVVKLGTAKKEAATLTQPSYTRVDIWLEDERSLEKKLSLVGRYKIAGFAAWRKGFETEALRTWLYNAYPSLAVPAVEKESREKGRGSSGKRR